MLPYIFDVLLKNSKYKENPIENATQHTDENTAPETDYEMLPFYLEQIYIGSKTLRTKLQV